MKTCPKCSVYYSADEREDVCPHVQRGRGAIWIEPDPRRAGSDPPYEIQTVSPCHDLNETTVIRAREILREWAGKQGHDRCWYYPDVFNELCRVLGVDVTVPAALPSPDEFDKGCKAFQRDLFEDES